MAFIDQRKGEAWEINKTIVESMIRSYEMIGRPVGLYSASKNQLSNIPLNMSDGRIMPYEFRRKVVAALLEEGLVWTHAFVIGELACGNMGNRAEILALLRALPTTDVAEHEEVMSFIERNRLMGTGVGYVDVHLLAATALSDVGLWTGDRSLASAAAELGVAYQPP